MAICVPRDRARTASKRLETQVEVMSAMNRGKIVLLGCCFSIGCSSGTEAGGGGSAGQQGVAGFQNPGGSPNLGGGYAAGGTPAAGRTPAAGGLPGSGGFGPGGSGPACVPGATQACFGPGQCPGAQVCNANGSGWGACDCGNPGTGGGSGSGGAGSAPLIYCSTDASGACGCFHNADYGSLGVSCSTATIGGGLCCASVGWPAQGTCSCGRPGCARDTTNDCQCAVGASGSATSSCTGVTCCLDKSFTTSICTCFTTGSSFDCSAGIQGEVNVASCGLGDVTCGTGTTAVSACN